MELLTKEAMQADRAGKVKGLVHTFARNLMSYLCMVAPIAVVGAVWFDMQPVVAMRKIYGGLPLVLIFVMAEMAMMDLGRDAGKKDKELIDIHGEFKILREMVVTAGTEEIQVFLDEEIAKELESERKRACRVIKLDYAVYLSECAGKSKKELMSKFKSRILGAKIYAINMIKPIMLTEDMVLVDAPVTHERRGIGLTGDEYCARKRGITSTVWSTASVFLLTGVALGPMRQFSWSMVIYTVWALFILGYRMARGYKDGVVAFAEVQVKNYKDRMRVMERYLEWVGERKKHQKNDETACQGAQTREG